MARRRSTRNATSPWPFVGMGLMACSLFLYGASGLVAPWWAVVGLLVLWAVQFAVACAWWSRHPRRVPVLGAFSMLLWFALVSAGGAWLGWTA